MYILTVRKQFDVRRDPLSFYADRKFVQRYRLSKEVVKQLVRNYVADMAPHKQIVRGRHAISHRIMFCIALRYFATGSNYSLVADAHGVSKSSVCRAVQSVSSFFHRHLSDYVIWPNTDLEKNNQAVLFLRDKMKPGCFGLIDGTHVPIMCPQGEAADENQYYCYKGYYSINTMVVCDWNCVIFHMNASNPGSCNDIYCLNGSQIKYYGERGDFAGFFLLGDSGYPLTDYLFTPTKSEETPGEVLYNRWVKKTRSKVERAIGQLKQRWRCLDSSGGYLMHDPRQAGYIIETCVALHNCARLARVLLLRDFPSKDGFRRVQARVKQPVNAAPRPRVAFSNLRADYIRQWFSNPR